MVRFRFSDLPITGSPDLVALCLRPFSPRIYPRPFSHPCCKQSTFSIRPLGLPCATLGWPLGHAWATQGPPKPNPKYRQRVATLHQVPSTKSQVPAFWLIARCYLLSFQRPCAARRCYILADVRYRINSEIGQCKYSTHSDKTQSVRKETGLAELPLPPEIVRPAIRVASPTQ